MNDFELTVPDLYINVRLWDLLPAATKLGQGNIFTSVCLSTRGVASGPGVSGLGGVVSGPGGLVSGPRGGVWSWGGGGGGWVSNFFWEGGVNSIFFSNFFNSNFFLIQFFF